MTLLRSPIRTLRRAAVSRICVQPALLVFFSLAIHAQAPATAPATQLLDEASIRRTGDILLQQARQAPTGVAFTNLIVRPGNTLQVAVRVKSGQAEWHRDDADLLICIEGGAEVVTGGTVTGGSTTAPGEIRGAAVEGGTRHAFRRGDILRIEPGTPHQFLLAPGATIRYLAVKSRPK